MKTDMALECVRLIRNDDGVGSRRRSFTWLRICIWCIWKCNDEYELNKNDETEAEDRLQVRRVNVATGLVNNTLASCTARKLKADNTSVVIICPETEESDCEHPEDYFSVNVTGNSFGKKTSVCVENLHDDAFSLAELKPPTQKSASEMRSGSIHAFLDRIVSVAFDENASRSDQSKVFMSNFKGEGSNSERMDSSKWETFRPPPLDSEDVLVGDLTSDPDAPVADDDVLSGVDPSNEDLESKDVYNSFLQEQHNEGLTLNGFPSDSGNASNSLENRQFVPSLFVEFGQTPEECRANIRSLKRKSKSYSGSDSKRTRCASNGSKSYSEGCKGRALVESLQACS